LIPSADVGAVKRRPTLLFLVTEDYYFVSHRLPLAVAAKAAGYDVCVATRVRGSGDVIRAAGIRLIPFENARGGLNPFVEIGTLCRLVLLYRQEQPDLVHHVAMKPVLYGTIAARLAGRSALVNAVAGMGWLFTSSASVTRYFTPVIHRALRHVLRSGIAVVQNPDDERLLAQLGVPLSQIRLVPGSGVDLQQFQPQPPPQGTPVVLLPARLLWDKGVGDFVAAARLLRRRGVAARFLLAGEPDPVNPASIPPAEVSSWVQEGIIEHLGVVADMPKALAACHIVCLPSYREGLPKSLLEAAAAGRPIVTTDVPGCRAIVTDGDNGLLVPPRNPGALAGALARLIGDSAVRAEMGARGRLRAEREFGLEGVIAKMLAVYAEALA
jgi:glycosyltransferase involved in cell wall biosynthesis